MELRRSLKIAEDRLLKVGSCFHVYRDFFYSVKKLGELSFSDSPYSWFRIVAARVDNNVKSKESIILTVEPCKLNGGSSQLSFDESRAICDAWDRSLNICKSINEMNIHGTREEIIECIIDIHNKRRKNF